MIKLLHSVTNAFLLARFVTRALPLRIPQVTSHLCIYTQQFNGDRTLYRHYLRLPDGTILELFGDMDSVGVSLGSQFNTLKSLLISQSQPHGGSRGASSKQAAGPGVNNSNIHKVDKSDDVSAFFPPGTSDPTSLSRTASPRTALARRAATEEKSSFPK